MLARQEAIKSILEQKGSGFGVSGSFAAIADVKDNTKGTDSIIVLSPVGTASTGKFN